nr:MAG TPA: hypothetical protein [Inoviridae sp.]
MVRGTAYRQLLPTPAFDYQLYTRVCCSPTL